MAMTRVTCLVHKGKEYTFSKYLASWGQELAPRVEVRHYPGLRATGRTPLKRLSQSYRAWRIGTLDDPPPAGDPQVYLFTDVERLDAAETERALEIHRRLEAHPDTALILNHPVRSMRRFEVLTALRARGFNTFGIYHAADLPESPRFPVFVRDENEHGTGFSGLLEDRDQLASHLETLEGRLDGKVVVEFCDASDASGIVRKYGAFRVAGRIIARQIHFSRHWVVREPDIRTPETAREELEYVETNPHAEQLREIFALARIDYGRVDYSVVDGRIQVWEINTNPMILIPKDRDDPLRFEAHDRFGRAFNEALESLKADAPADGTRGTGLKPRATEGKPPEGG